MGKGSSSLADINLILSGDETMVEQEYKTGFNFTMRDGTVRRVNSGKQEVPDEIANAPYAQHHLVEPPEELVKNVIPVYGKTGHEKLAFEQRDLGPEEPVLGVSTVTHQGVEADSNEEEPQPGNAGLSTRTATGRRRVVVSD